VFLVGGRMSMWDVTDPRAPTTLRDLDVAGAPDGGEYLTSVVFSADGTRMAVLRERAGVVTVFDVATGRRRTTVRMPAGTASAAAISPDGRTIAVTNTTSGQGASGVQFADLASGKLTGRLDLPYDPLSVGSIAYVRGGRALALVEVTRPVNQDAGDRGAAQLQLWDVATRRPLGDPVPVDAAPIGLVASRDGSRLATTLNWRLDDPVDDLLPELADRRVLIDPRGPIDGDTVPAARPITVHDVLTFRTGIGMDFDAPFPQPLLDAMDELGISTAPPRPQLPPEPDEWMRRLGTLPLLHQPGERWLYHHSADVLGVLIARASGQTLEEFLRERVFEPLGMHDTGFVAADVRRLGSSYERDPSTGAPVVFDPPEGQWSTPPAFPSASGGLVSTVDDLHAFARMLLDHGRLPNGERLLSRAAVEAMTTNQLGGAGITPDGSEGWGFGVSVQLRRTGLGPAVGAYGWTGGLGSSWSNDPHHDLVGVILTTDAFSGAFPMPAVIRDFWTDVYVALDD
jgi:CubicO group peptidase (beta-lactamase class C family)